MSFASKKRLVSSLTSVNARCALAKVFVLGSSPSAPARSSGFAKDRRFFFIIMKKGAHIC